MPIKVLSADEALRNRRGDISRWPSDADSQAKRIRPLAKPAFNASFRINGDELVFTVGSCFARNIEKQLAIEGFDYAGKSFAIPQEEGDFVSPDMTGLLNKYVVFSVLNELRWAIAPGEAFDESAYVKVRGGKWSDPHLHASIQPSSLERVRGRRRHVQEFFARAAQSGVFIMTLGMAEAWYDTRTGLYLNGMPNPRAEDLGRFEFHILDYNQILECLEQIHALLAAHGRPDLRMLVTVSPVTLGSTFSGDDCLIANTYSKSVQRAALAAFVARHENVDYFPSYESVTLSDRARGWEDDLVHASDEIVRYNVLAMMAAYVEGREDGLARADAAAEAAGLAEMAKVAAAAGDVKKAGALYARAAEIAPGEALVMQAYAEFLCRQKQFEKAVEAAKQAVAGGGGTYGAHLTLAQCCVAAHRFEDALAAITQSLDLYPGKGANLAILARIYAALDRHEDAMGVYEQLIDRLPAREAYRASREKLIRGYLPSATAAGLQARAERFLGGPEAARAA